MTLIIIKTQRYFTHPHNTRYEIIYYNDICKWRSVDKQLKNIHPVFILIEMTCITINTEDINNIIVFNLNYIQFDSNHIPITL